MSLTTELLIDAIRKVIAESRMYPERAYQCQLTVLVLANVLAYVCFPDAHMQSTYSVRALCDYREGLR